MNQEGYKDPTAEKAIREYNRMSCEMRKNINALQNVASLLGFEIMEVRDKRTRREYRLSAERKSDQQRKI